MPRGQHYVFAHRALPQIFQSDPERLLDLLSRGGDDFLLFLWNKVGEDMEPADLVEAEGLRCEVRQLDLGLQVALITLPSPQTVPEAYFVALAYRRLPEDGSSSESRTVKRYITLERGIRVPEGTTRTVLCEWAGGTHSNLGDGPEPELEAFFSTVRGLLAELGM